jgi:ABC-type nitrate/sulfonate/bicarbonate transport system substrate-binding protein
VRVLFTDHDVLGDIVLGNIVMNKAFVDQHAPAVKGFVTASAKASDWLRSTPTRRESWLLRY